MSLNDAVHNSHIRYVVIDEHTLGFNDDRWPTPPEWYQVLRASVLKGAGWGFYYETVVTPGLSKVRDATLEDFESFRSRPPKGYPEGFRSAQSH